MECRQWLWALLAGIVNGIHGFEDLPFSPQAQKPLATRSRRIAQPRTAERIRELARLHNPGGSDAAGVPEIVDRMVEFGQRFSGLWYSILRDHENGMEYLLEECTVYQTGFGPAFRGIMDGAWTTPLYILQDGRTLMRLGGQVPDRVIDSSVIQRIESHALLAVAGRWPHRRYTLTAPSGAEPAVGTGAFPPAVPEATGPANRWWFDGDRAVLLRLRSWWTRRAGTGMTRGELDHWTMWCFARTESGLAWASACRADIPGAPSPGWTGASYARTRRRRMSAAGPMPIAPDLLVVPAEPGTAVACARSAGTRAPREVFQVRG
jgi:hypothetical protein